MENREKEVLKVSAIKNGTVLDHIPSEQLFRVIDILRLNLSTTPITFGMNLDSKSLKSKAIIKISDRFFEDDEINRIALIAPNASMNIIRNFEVIEKRVLSIPETITGIVRCINPVCVTNHQEIETKFHTYEKDGKIELHCHYCEKTTGLKNLKIITNDR
ncbi:MAG: aspartate carbamoyltransferase regulatory subunit [Bacteroidales bacterium]|nr:aspartate carbamoyltransferase regulatory subunit [Bacteroidales bacterium]